MSDSDPNDWNASIISEFRANQGRVGGAFEGAPVILLHHTGAKTGKERVNPLVYQAVGRNYAIFASKAGAPAVPHWFLNLEANPETEVEVGTETLPVRARVLEGTERDAIWAKQKELMHNFAEYEEKTKGVREIPVILLERED
jgi:deazaflavin-dependent oxidoreductase (nitroreductase family)